jgi:large subunit ribosomal protein L9
MKLLLCENINKLGIVGDVVEVAPGYGRNYLLPQGLATEPTEGNMRALAKRRREAELDRAKKRAELEALAVKLQDVEVTIRARANEEGVLYGSVGTKEIVDALAEDGFYLHAEQVALDRPLRRLDTETVPIKLGDDLLASVKVWVVREKTEEDEDAEGTEENTGKEAGADDHGADK